MQREAAPTPIPEDTPVASRVSSPPLSNGHQPRDYEAVEKHTSCNTPLGESVFPVGSTETDLEGNPLNEIEPAEMSPFHLAIFDDNLRCFPLVAGTLVVGRSKRNHLQLHDHLLSRKHCSLTLHKGILTLVDLNSSNGTFVNGVRVATQELVVDDLVELGQTVMVIFDGDSWRRGQGLLNLRNPVKAQELVQRLREGADPREVPRVGPPAALLRPGDEIKKGLDDRERAFLSWLERGETRLLPDLVTEYLTHNLVSLLVRNSSQVRATLTGVLEDLMRPEFFQRFEDVAEMRKTISDLVREELADLRDEPPGAVSDRADRGLLEPQVGNEDESETEAKKAVTSIERAALVEDRAEVESRPARIEPAVHLDSNGHAEKNGQPEVAPEGPAERAPFGYDKEPKLADGILPGEINAPGETEV